MGVDSGEAGWVGLEAAGEFASRIDRSTIARRIIAEPSAAKIHGRIDPCR